VSLETGSQDAFAPARTLYATAGFTVCGPFADYPDSPLSVFMGRDLPPPP
jgi:putative acetyltransferase